MRRDRFPPPIEEIAEIKCGLDIIPLPGLRDLLEVDGFISSDLSCITVDQFVLERRLNRYRFTLARRAVSLRRGASSGQGGGDPAVVGGPTTL
jgi:hypothetical protein